MTSKKNSSKKSKRSLEPTDRNFIAPKKEGEPQEDGSFADDEVGATKEIEYVPPTKKTYVRPEIQALTSLGKRDPYRPKTEKDFFEDDAFADTVKLSPSPLLQGAKNFISSLGANRKKSSDSTDGQTDTSLLPLPTLSNSRRFGSYEIIDEIARKPLGNSYKARHVEKDRIFFLKILTSEEDLSEKYEERIKKTRKLVHPRIINYTDFGTIEGLFYIASEFFEGDSLQRKLENYLSVKDGLEIIHQVLTVLEYAHNQGVVHGGLSPSNIFIDQDGKVKISDFALPLTVNQTLNTLPPAEIGYLGLYYTDPHILLCLEKAEPTSDLYSAGALLYHILTEHYPIQGDSLGQLLENAETPVLLNNFSKDIHQGLVAIMQKATHPKIQKRYPNVRMFAQDIENFLHFRPVVGAKTLFGIGSISFKQISLFFLGLACFLFLLSISFFYQLSSLKIKLTEKDGLLQEQKARIGFQNGLLAQALLEKSTNLLNKKPQIAALYAAEADELKPSQDAKSLMSQAYLKTEKVCQTYKPLFAKIQQFALASNDTALSVDSLKGIQEWNIENGELLDKKNLLLDYKKGPLLASNDSFYCAIQNEIRQYGLKDFAFLARFKHDAPVITGLLAQHYLFTGTEKGKVYQWDLRSKRRIKVFPIGVEAISALAFREKNNTLYAAHGNNITILKLDSYFQQFNIRPPHTRFITQLRVCESLQLLFSSGLDERIQGLELETGKLLHTFVGHEGGVTDFCFDTNSSRMYSISNQGELFSWSLKPFIKNDLPLNTLKLRSFSLQKVLFASSASKLVISSQKGVHFITLPKLVEEKQISGFDYGNELSFLLDEKNQKIFTGDREGSLLSWDLKSQKPLQYFKGLKAKISSLALSSSGKELYCGDSNGLVLGWDTESPDKEDFYLKQHMGPVVALYRYNQYLYSSSKETGLLCTKILPQKSHQKIWEGEPATSLFLFPKKNQLWAAGFDGKIICYQRKDGEPFQQWKISLGEPIQIVHYEAPKHFYLISRKTLLKWNFQTGKVESEYLIPEEILCATVSDALMFLGTSKGLHVLHKKDGELSLVFSFPQKYFQLFYAPELESLFSSSSHFGFGQWESELFLKKSWLKKEFWEQKTQRKISNFEVIPLETNQK